MAPETIVPAGDDLADPAAEIATALTVTRDLDALVCWMTGEQLRPRQRIAVKHTSRSVRAVVTELQYRLDVNTQHRDSDATALGRNDIGRVRLRTTAPLFVDDDHRNRATGRFILIDGATNATVGAGMLTPAT